MTWRRPQPGWGRFTKLQAPAEVCSPGEAAQEGEGYAGHSAAGRCSF